MTLVIETDDRDGLMRVAHRFATSLRHRNARVTTHFAPEVGPPVRLHLEAGALHWCIDLRPAVDGSPASAEARWALEPIALLLHHIERTRCTAWNIETFAAGRTQFPVQTAVSLLRALPAAPDFSPIRPLQGIVTEDRQMLLELEVAYARDRRLDAHGSAVAVSAAQVTVTQIWEFWRALEFGHLGDPR